MEDLSHLKFTHHEEWIDIKGDEITVGITDFAQSKLGDIVHVELPEPDEQPYDIEDALGEISSLSESMEFHGPVPGIITAINTNLLSNPELINSDPFQKGWILKIKPTDMSSLDELLDIVEYEAFLPEEDDE
ncbi:MAG: glycine cleavage system protein GcvH [Kiritimatiellae bacterium]|nr:glycine cleavage system protein GcvH [Kiritimatiellia bacterium]